MRLLERKAICAEVSMEDGMKESAMMKRMNECPALRIVLAATLFVVFVAALVRGQEGATEPNEPTDANDLPAVPSFVKDGKVDVDAVVKYFEDLYRSESSISVAKLTVTKPRRERTLEMKMWTRGEERALVVVQSPAREKGTATLKVEKNLWNYLPRIKRTIRIPPSMMLASWMGSDFTNDDLVKESSYSKDYVYELVGPSDEPKGWLVRFNAKPDIVGLWSRFELIVNENATIPLQARYYDRKDRLARTLHWSEVKVFDGKRIPSHMTLIPQDREGHKTEMIYLDIDFDVKVPDTTFSLSNLEKKR